MISAGGAAVFAYPGPPPGQVETTAARCRTLAGRAAAAARSLGRDPALLRDAWEGSAADACSRELGHIAALTSAAAPPLGEAARVLEVYREAVTRARAEVDRLRAAYDDELAAHRAATGLLSTDATIPHTLRRLALT
ncbi:MAG: hypothetical protein ACRDV2_01455, partial [Actinomycetes bacterium]